MGGAWLTHRDICPILHVTTSDTDLQPLTGLLNFLEVLQHGHHVLLGSALQAVEFGTLIHTEKQIT